MSSSINFGNPGFTYKKQDAITSGDGFAICMVGSRRASNDQEVYILSPYGEYAGYNTTSDAGTIPRALVATGGAYSQISTFLSGSYWLDRGHTYGSGLSSTQMRQLAQIFKEYNRALGRET